MGSLTRCTLYRCRVFYKELFFAKPKLDDRAATIVGLFTIALLSGCTQQLPNYDYYQALPVEEITAQYASPNGEQPTDNQQNSTALESPRLIEIIELEPQSVQQTIQLSAKFSPEERRLALFFDTHFQYQQKIKTLSEPLFYDRARVNSGNLLVLDAKETNKSCDKKYCEFSQSLSVPLTVATLRNSRYSGLVVEAINPSQQSMVYRLPDTFLRAFNQQVEQLLENNNTDYERITDAHARPMITGNRDQLHVEDMAKSADCLRTSVRPLHFNGPKSQFLMECDNNTYRTVQCEWGKCEFLQTERK